MSLDLEGEAYNQHRHIEQSLSFGLDSQRLNRSSQSFSFDYLGVEGSLSLGNTDNGFKAGASGSVIHAEGAFSVDHSRRIPKISVSGNADFARFHTDAKYYKGGMEHKVLTFDGSLVGISAKFDNQHYIPVAKLDAHAMSISPSAAMGHDALQVKLSKGCGITDRAGLYDAAARSSGPESAPADITDYIMSHDGLRELIREAMKNDTSDSYWKELVQGK